MDSQYQSSTRKIKIDVHALAIGMFVCDLDRPWIESPFLLQGFLLQTPGDIQSVQNVCDYVYVDPEKGTRKNGTQPIAGKPKRQDYVFNSTFEDAYTSANKTYQSTHALVKSTMDDIRFGNAIDTSKAKGAIKNCVDAILQNPNTMILLAQIKDKDEYTSQHSLNVCILSIVIGRHLGMSIKELEDLGLCGLLHDMGKIKIPLEILNKEGNLSPDEFEIMKQHSILGRDILISARNVPPSTVDVAYSHHEKLDGSGYPRGIKAEGITQNTRIVTIADTYDAITSERVYQTARPHLQALNILTKARGSHFDTHLVISFIACIGVYPPGSIVEFSNGEVGIVFEVTPTTKTKPKVLLVLDANKAPRKESVLDLSKSANSNYIIKEVLKQKAHGIDIKTYIDKGLVVKGPQWVEH